MVLRIVLGLAYCRARRKVGKTIERNKKKLQHMLQKWINSVSDSPFCVDKRRKCLYFK